METCIMCGADAQLIERDDMTAWCWDCHDELPNPTNDIYVLEERCLSLSRSG